MTGDLLGFLRRELAYSPERLRATGRLVVSCTIGVVLAQALRLEHGHWVIITIFTLALGDAGASVRKAGQRMLGTIAGGVVGILAAILCTDQPWLIPPVVVVLGALGIHLTRTSTSPYVGFLAVVTVMLVLTAPGEPGEANVEFGLLRFVGVAIGLAIGTAGQLLLWPTDSQERLQDDLATRLHAVAEVLGARLDDRPLSSPELASGLARDLDLLASAEAQHPGLRPRHTAQLAMVNAVERMLVSALAFAQPAVPLGPVTRTRVEALRSAVLAAHGALLARRPVPARSPVPTSSDGGLLAPLLADMENAFDLLSMASDPHPVAGVPALTEQEDPLAEQTFLTPRFFAPLPVDVRSALAAGLSAALCFVILRAIPWPGISTSVVTCIIIAQATMGANRWKAMLRTAGALLGGLLALVTTLVLLPVADSVASLAVASALGFGVAGWITVGSPRISYAGFQAALAYSLGMVDLFVPSADLLPLRDRVLGILLAIAVSAVVHVLIGMQRARDELVPSLANVLDALERLARIGIGTDHVPLTATREARSGVYASLSTTLRLHDEASLEPRAEGPAEQALSAAVLRATGDAQTVFLALLALVRHRLLVPMSERGDPARPERRALGVAIADALGTMRDALAAQRRPPRLDLAAPLAALHARTTADAAPDLRDRVALYEHVARQLDRLSADVEDPVLVSIAVPAAASSGVSPVLGSLRQ